MSVLYSFFVVGTFCLIGEIIINNTKLSPGHVTSLYALVGAILAFFGIYKKLIKICNMGALILISNFGNSLYEAGLKGFQKNGVLGLLKNLLTNSSFVICSTIIFSFIFICLFRAKD